MSRKKPQQRSYLYYNPERVDYSITAEEMARLETEQSNLWKEVTLVAVPLAIATLINAWVEGLNQAQFHVTPGIFLNALIGSVSFACALICGIAWYRTRKRFASILKSIKDKPRIELPADLFDVGPLPLPTPEADPTKGEPGPT